MVLVIDNYDSFTYNLVQALGRMGEEVAVLRNDAVTPEDVEELLPGCLVISPGPGRPEDAGNCLSILRRFAGRLPTLGVCLGHQALGLVFGAAVVRAPEPVHGKASLIYHSGEGIFEGLPRPFPAGRYHSLVLERSSLPPSVEVVAEDESGLVMGIRCRGTRAWGVQFHPESVLTPNGDELLRNFLRLARK